jgi:hypothetical protein
MVAWTGGGWEVEGGFELLDGEFGRGMGRLG